MKKIINSVLLFLPIPYVAYCLVDSVIFLAKLDPFLWSLSLNGVTFETLKGTVESRVVISLFSAALLLFLVREFVRYVKAHQVAYEVKFAYEQFKEARLAEKEAKKQRKLQEKKEKLQEEKEKLQKQLQDMEEAP